ncbi:MAG: hypothetical protein AB7V16_04080 [Vulcanibacillus sp.]
MGFAKDELNNIPTEIKKNIARTGGKKINVNLVDFEYYNSEAVGIQQQLIATEQMIIDGIFTLFDPLVIKKGYVNGGLEIEYDIYVQFSWSNTPEFAWVDTLALAWQNIVVPYGDATGKITRYPANDPLHPQERILIAHEEIEGDYWEVDVFTGGDGDTQRGYGLQTVRVNKYYEGFTGVLETAYAHMFIPSFVVPEISYGNITFDLSSLFGEEWNIRYNFTY